MIQPAFPQIGVVLEMVVDYSEYSLWSYQQEKVLLKVAEQTKL